MKGGTENSETKFKTIAFYSTDDHGFFVKYKRAPDGVLFAIQTDSGTVDIELSRAEALELADFLRRGL